MVNDYQRQIEGLKRDDESFRAIVGELSSLRHGHAAIFAHDDPDGICSAAMLHRLFSGAGLSVSCFFPPTFVLSPEQVRSCIGDDRSVTHLVIADKGTFERYHDLGRPECLTLVIDHHPPMGIPDRGTLVFNPNIDGYWQVSTSLLVHMIMTELGVADPWADFMSLLGLKGDFAVEPVTGFVAPYCSPFMESIRDRFSKLLRAVERDATMFDVTQRSRTCELSRIAEMVHVVSGGGFQFYFKDRDSSLADIDEPMMVMSNLLPLDSASAPMVVPGSLEEFMTNLPDRDRFERIFGFFKEDWNTTISLLDRAVPLMTLGTTACFFFCGAAIPLLPMIGSVQVYQLKTKGHIEEVIGLFVNVLPEKTHLSARGSGTQVHCGRICSRLAALVNEEFPGAGASGGGHPKAAECTVSPQGCSPLVMMNLLFGLLVRIQTLASRAERDEASLNELKESGFLWEETANGIS